MSTLTNKLIKDTYNSVLKVEDNGNIEATSQQITDGVGNGTGLYLDNAGNVTATTYSINGGLSSQFLKADGSIDSSSYLLSSEPAGSITSAQVTNWDTAYGWGDHSAQSYATEAYVNTEIANIIDSSPEALNTLNELAASLGDDADFAGTMTTALAGKADLNHSHAINDINEINVGTLSTDQILRYNGTNIVNGELTDISGYNNTNWDSAYSSIIPNAISNPSNGDFLRYNSTAGNWENVSFAAANDNDYVDGATFVDGDLTLSVGSQSDVTVNLDGRYSLTSHSHSLASTSSAGFMSAADKTKLDTVATGAEVNVNADWDATTGDAAILNKPTIPTNNNQLTNGAGYITSYVNTQRSNEEIQDIVGTMLSGSGATTVNYNDAAGTLTISSTDTNTDTNTQRSDEDIRDVVAAMLVGGSNVTVSENDAANTLTISSSFTNTDTTSFNISAEGGMPENISANETIDFSGSGSVSVSRSGNDITITGTDTNTDTNYYLDNITKSGNTLNFVMNGKADESYTFGSNAFNSTTIPTNNNQLTNGAGYITSYTNTQRTDEEIRDVIGAMITGSGATSVNYDDANNTLNISSTDTNTNTNYYLNNITKSGNKLTFVMSGKADEEYTFGSNAFTSTTIPTNNNQLTNGAGYVTSSGNTVIGTDSDINTSGATVIDQLNMTDGVIQSHSTRNMTLADLGYTGDTNANRITNNNQLTNGAGYITDGNTNWNNSYGFITASYYGNVPSSGDWYSGGPAVVGTDGVMEIGRYIDFHDSDGESSDYSVRLQGANSTLTVTGNVHSTGTITAAGDVIAYYSDERLKKDFEVIPNALDKLKEINGYTYYSNELAEELGVGRGDRQVGVKAQEIEKVLGEAVHNAPLNQLIQDKNVELEGGDILTVDYSKLTALLIQALKEETAAREELEKRVESQKQSILWITNRLNKLENKVK